MQKVIEKQNRLLLAKCARQMVTCRISAQQFDDWLLQDNNPINSSEDNAVINICYGGFWTLYDDVRTEYLTGDWALSREGKRDVARWMLFLHTALPYEWPYLGMRARLGRFVNWITGGLVRFRGCTLEDYGDTRIWPFYRQADYEVALKRPPLLCGKQAV